MLLFLNKPKLLLAEITFDQSDIRTELARHLVQLFCCLAKSCSLSNVPTSGISLSIVKRQDHEFSSHERSCCRYDPDSRWPSPIITARVLSASSLHDK